MRGKMGIWASQRHLSGPPRSHYLLCGVTEAPEEAYLAEALEAASTAEAYSRALVREQDGQAAEAYWEERFGPEPPESPALPEEASAAYDGGKEGGSDGVL